MIENWILVTIFLCLWILPVLIPYRLKKCIIWKKDDALTDKLFKTSGISIVITGLLTFMFTVKPVNDFKYLKSENKRFKQENKQLADSSHLLKTLNSELTQKQARLQDNIEVLEDSLETTTFELLRIKETKKELDLVNSKLSKDIEILGNEKEQLINEKKNLESRFVSIENSIYLSSLNIILSDLVDFKHFQYGYKEPINFHVVLKAYFENHPVEKLDDKYNRQYYENESKKIIIEYGKTIEKDKEFSIETAYTVTNYFIQKYYKLTY